MKKNIFGLFGVAVLLFVIFFPWNEFLSNLAYPEFNEKNIRREVMEQDSCFEAGGIWWLHDTGECGFKREEK